MDVCNGNAVSLGKRGTYPELCLCDGRKGKMRSRKFKQALALARLLFWQHFGVFLSYCPFISHILLYLQVKEKGRDRAELRMDQVKVIYVGFFNAYKVACEQCMNTERNTFQLRNFKSELDIEEIVKHRTEQIFQVNTNEDLQDDICCNGTCSVRTSLPHKCFSSRVDLFETHCSFQAKCADHL